MTARRDKADVRQGIKARAKGLKSKPPRIYVYELREKLAALLASRPDLSKAALYRRGGIQPTSLARAIGTGNAKAGIEAGDSRLGYDDQQRLAELFEFPAVDIRVDGKLETMWPEWRDIEASAGQKIRRDTAKAFAERYRQHWRARRSPGPTVVEQPSGEREARQENIRLGPGQQQPVKQLIAIKIASVSVEGQQWGEGSVAILLTLACSKNRELSVMRGRIQISPGYGRMTMPSFIDWQQPKIVTSPGSGNQSKVVIERGGTRFDPHLDVNGLNGPIGTIVIDGDMPALEGLAPGDEVTVTFGTWLADVGSSWQSHDETEREADLSGSDGRGDIASDAALTAEPVRKLTAYQKWAIAMIRQELFGGAGPDGYIEVSRHALRIGRCT